jgi:uncharacterized protein (TIGR03066 family)
MHALKLTAVAGLALAFAGPMRGADKADSKDKPNSEKIVGTWKLTKIGGKDAPIEIEMVFTKDGKIKLMGRDHGTYKVDGDKIMLTITKKGGKDSTQTIKTLTTDTMVLYDEEEKGEIEFKKK